MITKEAGDVQSRCDNLGGPPNERSQSAKAQPLDHQFRERPCVLVVDDEPLVRAILQLGLERDNFDVWLASNGRDAIEVYEKRCDKIAVVLLDVGMPGLDGLQTLDALRKLNPK